MVPFPTQKVTDSEFLHKSFVINVLQFQFFFAKPSMDFIQLWHDDRALSKILCSTIPIPVHDLKIKVTDFEFFCVKSLQCQLLQSLWVLWIVFGMNGYKILKCFRKEYASQASCPVRRQVLFKTKLSRNKKSEQVSGTRGRCRLNSTFTQFLRITRTREACEYQIKRSLTHMSEWRDYLVEFEWSVPGVKEENTAVCLYNTVKIRKNRAT